MSDRPLLVFDGDCGFCRFWVARWRHQTRDRVEFQPFQNPDIPQRLPHIQRDAFSRAVHLIEPDGHVSTGARAVFRLLAISGPRTGARVWGSMYERVPGVAYVSEHAYRFVADHRPLFGALTGLLWGRVTTPSTYAVSSWMFRRLLGVIYLAAFWSLAGQVLGLLGHQGILPAQVYMDAERAWAAADHVGVDRFRLLPTVFWISASDLFLHGVCVAGIALSVLLIAGIAPLVVLPLLWLAYLSLSVVGQEFLGYQWDALLLETGFLAIFIAPRGLRDRLRQAADPPRLARALLWWLLFRLMAGSGAVKLASGDPTWRSLTALTFHFETQPIPTPVAWYAHQFPVWFHKASTAVVLGIELCVPLLILAPRRPRVLACVLLVALQAVMALTGNYAFFNLLAAALCVLLVDDAALAWMQTRRDGPARAPEGVGAARRWAVIAAAAVTLPVSLLAFAGSYGVRASAPVVTQLAAFIDPFRIVNTYGLFAIMTTTRPEIVVEGSDDGVTWRAYEFRYKPGDLHRRPPWVAPHQPRLDWQMWFAALGDDDDEPWLRNFFARLLEGSPDVLRLLERDPFDGRPPRHLRAVRYQYRFADAAQRRNDGLWWTRDATGGDGR